MRKLLILLVAAAFVFTMALPAMAQDKKVDFYGSVRVQTYWQTLDKENNGTAYNDDDLRWSLDDGSSRFGARFKAGDMGANVEIRPRDQNANSYGGSTNHLRHWYGSWDFGSGTLIVGQTWTPTFHPICNECLVGGGGILDAYGDMGGSVRQAGMQFWFPMRSLNGMLKVALLEPTTTRKPGGASAQGLPQALVPGPGYLIYPGQAAIPVATDADTTIPAIEASLAMAFGNLDLYVRGGYNTYDLTAVATDQSESIDSWLFGIDFTYSMGPFYFRGLGYFGQNLAAFGSHAPNSNGTHGFSPSAFLNSGGNIQIEDSDNTGFFGVVGFKFSDKVSLELGYGQRKVEQDNPTLNFSNEDKKSAWTVFLPITVAKGFTMTPEVLWTDEGDITVNGVTQDRGNTLRLGIYWRIDF
jgi:hypothetical protein